MGLARSGTVGFARARRRDPREAEARARGHVHVGRWTVHGRADVERLAPAGRGADQRARPAADARPVRDARRGSSGHRRGAVQARAEGRDRRHRRAASETRCRGKRCRARAEDPIEAEAREKRPEKPTGRRPGAPGRRWRSAPEALGGLWLPVARRRRPEPRAPRPSEPGARCSSRRRGPRSSARRSGRGTAGAAGSTTWPLPRRIAGRASRRGSSTRSRPASATSAARRSASWSATRTTMAASSGPPAATTRARDSSRGSSGATERGRGQPTCPDRDEPERPPARNPRGGVGRAGPAATSRTECRAVDLRP